VRSMRSERKPRKPGRGSPSRSPRISRANRPARGARRPPDREPLWSELAGRLSGRLKVKRPVLIFAGGLACFVLVIAAFAGGYVHRAVRSSERATAAITDGAGFGVHNLRIAGNARVSTKEIVAALGVVEGQSIFNLDLRAARARLMALDWISDAQVRRRYPDSIDVRISERQPFALWQSPNGLFVIERSGRVISGRGLTQFTKLPKLAGAGANGGADIADAVAAHRALAARVVIMERMGERRWNLILDDGVVVKLPEKDWQKQLDVLEHLIVDKGVLERDISEIDLRSATHYFFVLKSTVKKDDGGKQI